MAYATSAQQAANLSEEERQRRNKTFDTAMGQLGGVSSALSSFYGPNGMSDWKRGQTQLRNSSTTANYNNALSGQRRRAAMSGFGYAQPAEQAGETNVENARAQELSRIPAEVEAESVPIQMNAMNLQNQIAGTEAGIGRSYDPMGYYGSAVGQDQAEMQRKQALWQSIIGAATGIGGAALGGYLSRGK
jgi:hypothetical protein